jgi:hypothetical protein
MSDVNIDFTISEISANLFISGIVETANVSVMTGLKYGTETVAVHNTTSGTYALNVLDNSIAYSTANAVGNITLNIRGNNTTTFNSMVNSSNSVTVTYMMTTGATGYNISTVQVDGATQTVRYVSNITPALNSNCITNYTYTIIKTSNTPTYVVLGSQTRYG